MGIRPWVADAREYAGDFDEAEHPRDKDGKFAEKGGEASPDANDDIATPEDYAGKGLFRKISVQTKRVRILASRSLDAVPDPKTATAEEMSSGIASYLDQVVTLYPKHSLGNFNVKVSPGRVEISHGKMPFDPGKVLNAKLQLGVAVSVLTEHLPGTLIWTREVKRN